MNVEAVLKYGNVIAQWEKSTNHIAPWTSSDVVEIVQEPGFQSWYDKNPNGTIDQYYLHLRAIREYHNSPEYKIKSLEATVNELYQKNSALKNDLWYLQAEVSELESRLEIVGTTAFSTSILLIIVSCVLFYKLRKKR